VTWRCGGLRRLTKTCCGLNFRRFGAPELPASYLDAGPQLLLDFGSDWTPQAQFLPRLRAHSSPSPQPPRRLIPRLPCHSMRCFASSRAPGTQAHRGRSPTILSRSRSSFRNLFRRLSSQRGHSSGNRRCLEQTGYSPNHRNRFHACNPSPRASQSTAYQTREETRTKSEQSTMSLFTLH
jgi:hypothetical protein